MKKQILLANASLSDQSELQSLVDRMGFSLSVVENAQEALAMAMESKRSGEPYSLLLLDMDLPGQSSGNLSRNLRFSGYNAPIIAIVEALGCSDDYTARDGGCDDVITRPLADKGTLCKLQRYVMA